jgi:glutathione S-transferase
MPRRIIEYEPLPEVDVDPAIEAFIAAKDAFRRRITVTPERIVAYLDARLAQAKALRGSEIQVDDIDAFVVFQRLREIDVLFDGVLRSRYRVSRIEGRVSNGWLDCPDFMIERIPAAARRGAGKVG